MPYHGYADMEEFLYYAVYETFESRYNDDKTDGRDFYESTIKPFDSLRDYIEEFICDQIPDNMMRSVVLRIVDYDFIWKQLIEECTNDFENDA